MKQKIFLTSALAMGFVAPAFAEPSHTDSFPSDGYMQEDYTYTKAATADNMDSVYEGSVNAIAEYTEIPYSAAEGFYLTGVDDNNNATTAECTSGNFCPGVTSTTYENNAFGNTGLQSCSTATSGAYTLSDAGASSSGQCYRTCDGNVSISHATGVTGNDYSDGTNTCAPTGCDNGYHPKAAVTAPNIGTDVGVGYTSNRSTGSEFSSENMSNTIIANDPLAFAVDYGTKGIIKGHGRCSTRNVANPWYNQDGYTFESDHFVSNLTDETGTGKYCYCQLDSYTPNGGSATALSSPWVFAGDYGSASDCANDCANVCKNHMLFTDSYYFAFRAAVLGAIESSPAMCEANTITINWNDVDPEYAGQNNEGTATYGSDVRTPVKAKIKKGQTFRGWRFSAPEQTTTGN